MSTASMMHCRHCEKYIGKKNNLDDYFFWCDKACHDANEKEILERNLASMDTHHDRYKDKKKFGMGGASTSSSSSGNIIDNVIDSSTTTADKKVEKKKKTRTKNKGE